MVPARRNVSISKANCGRPLIEPVEQLQIVHPSAASLQHLHLAPMLLTIDEEAGDAAASRRESLKSYSTVGDQKRESPRPSILPAE